MGTQIPLHGTPTGNCNKTPCIPPSQAPERLQGSFNEFKNCFAESRKLKDIYCETLSLEITDHPVITAIVLSSRRTQKESWEKV